MYLDRIGDSVQIRENTDKVLSIFGKVRILFNSAHICENMDYRKPVFGHNLGNLDIIWAVFGVVCD